MEEANDSKRIKFVSLVDTRLFILIGMFDVESVAREDIEKAYWNTILEFHPKRWRDPSADLVRRTITSAYMILTDEELKNSYIASGRYAFSDEMVKYFDLDWSWIDVCIEIYIKKHWDEINLNVSSQQKSPIRNNIGFEKNWLEIISHKTRKKVLSFKVRFITWPKDTNTWIPLDEMVKYDYELNEYLESLAVNQPSKLNRLTKQNWSFVAKYLTRKY